MMVKITLEESSMTCIPVAYFEERYLVSEDGYVLNLANNTKLKPTKNPNGYLKVGLAKGDGTHHQTLLHILVAKHHIPNPYNYPQVNHKNGNKEDCSKGNLEWCTSKQNNLHALKTGLRKGYMSADDKEHYLQLVLDGKQVKELAKEINRRPETLHKMLRETAKRLGTSHLWVEKMKENRANAARKNLLLTNS